MNKNVMIRLILKGFGCILGALVIIGCNPSITTTPQSVIELSAFTDTANPPTVTFTALPSATATVLPSPTSTLRPSATQTITPSVTPTGTPSHTATAEPATITINQSAICRTGPGTLYDVDTYLVEGFQTSVHGRVIDDSWWLIGLSEVEDRCWVSIIVADVHGEVKYLTVLTPPPLPTRSPTPTIEASGIFYYLIAENTGGPFGCGDGLVRIYPGIKGIPTFNAKVKAILNAMFSNHSKHINNFLNPIYASNMRAKSATLDPVTGAAVIQINGTFVKPKDKCESLRMHDQVFKTIYQFGSIKSATVYMNNALLGDLMEK